MRRKEILKLPPVPAKISGKVITAQVSEDGTAVILNGYKDKKLVGRYLMDKETHDFCYLEADTGKFSEGKLMTMMGYSTYWGYSDYHHDVKMSRKDIDLVREELKTHSEGWNKEVRFKNIASVIDSYEYSTNFRKRQEKEDRRQMRLKALMDTLPMLPENLDEWMHQTAAGSLHYAFFNKESGMWTCTACLKEIKEKELLTEDGKKVTQNKIGVCPYCKAKLTAKKRVSFIEMKTHGMVLQNIDEKSSAARHFDFKITWDESGVHVERNEAIRLLIYRPEFNPKHLLVFYYNQWYSGIGGFDRRNPANRHIYEGYLYPSGIEEALRGTIYEGWTRPFGQMALSGTLLNYNRCMAAGSSPSVIGLMEYLYKGKFLRLLRESADRIGYFYGKYSGPLKDTGKTIEEVFQIRDRQKINRIRDCDGGELVCEWMRWSERNMEKIPEETMKWLDKEGVEPRDISFIKIQMSPTQIMNYVKRQQKESYPKWKVSSVMSQWEDYIRMCREMKKHMDDPMVYRPRELKRRHDEMVEEINRQKEVLKADEVRRKYPGAEEILDEIRPRYEYANGDYMILVPERLVDIMTEGRILHHCAGTTDRYFERIRNRETYICFLRKAAEPDKAFYTIEVEPSGTIRQHRSFFDEEPGIEEIRDFLREWQKVLRKRLTEEDKKYGAISAVKRLENIEELKAKNNTRVLEGLEQDFMEAI